MDLLKNEIQPLVENAVTSMGVDPGLVGRLLQPARELDQGDLSLPCFAFAKTLGMAPAAIAEQLCEALPLTRPWTASPPSTATSTCVPHPHGWRNKC